VGDDALVAGGVPGGRDHRQAGHDVGVPVEQLEPRAGEAEPVVQVRRLAPGAVELRALHVERGMREDRVLAAVVEMQMRVDHQIDIARGHVQPGERVRDRAVDHPPVVQPLLRAADAGVHQHRTPGVGDHEAVHRPLQAVDSAQARQVQPPDLQLHASSSRLAAARHCHRRADQAPFWK
jgi:hypothetical protein